jgi:F0F1-type ATP synthase assembly protein I
VPDKGRQYREMLRLSTVGITVSLAVMLGAGGGLWLDNRYETSPLFTLIGFVIGVAAAVRELLRALKGR